MAMTRLSAEYPRWRPEETKIIAEVPVRFRDICVHEFQMGDVEDIDIYAAQPIWEWQQSESGSWIMSHAETEPYWIQHMEPATMGYRIKIMARLSEHNETFWRLKWGGSKK